MSQDQVMSSLQVLCSKLGIKPSCIRKASDFHELLETRVSATSLAALRLPGSCKLVICLDLAAQQAGETPEKKDTIRLSGLSKKGYVEAFKIVSALLGQEDRVSLRELAVQFGCAKVIPEAADILGRYTKQQCSEMDFSSTMFLCAALLVAARNQKVKIDSTKLRERSGTKKSTFDRLFTEMQKHVVVETSEAKKQHAKKRRGLMDAIDEQILEDDRLAKFSKKDDDDADPSDKQEQGSKKDYEEWKRRILAKATRASS